MIGPTIPEGLKKKNEAEIEISFSDDENDTIGPQIPSEILEKKKKQAEIATGPQKKQGIHSDEISNLNDNDDDMVTVGPQIPKHIIKQKESASTAGPQIPEHLLQQKRQQVTTNHSDEIIMSNEEEVSVGPQIPVQLLERKRKANHLDEVDDDLSKKRSITPPLPSVAAAEEEEDFTPALPPDLLEQRRKQQQPEITTKTNGRRRRPVGPTFPTGPIPQQRDDDDNYLVGPALPANYNPEEEAKYSAIRAIEERARMSKESMEKKEQDKGKVERPEWMLLPPEVDYLKQASSGKSRSFTNNSLTKAERDSSGWTETPAEKEQRLKDEARGKRKPDAEEASFAVLEYEKRRNIQQYNQQTRPLSLLELHQQKKKKTREPTEDVTKRAFDREKDLMGSKRIGRKEKKEMLQQSNDLNQKFGYGSSSFL